MSDEFTGNRLPPFPVDAATLDMMWAALHPDHIGPNGEASFMSEFMRMMDELGGSDPRAVKEVISPGLRLMRDQSYHNNDVISALVTEVRRLRALNEGAE